MPWGRSSRRTCTVGLFAFGNRASFSVGSATALLRSFDGDHVPVQPGHEPLVERVLARIDIVERRDRHRLGAMLAQEARETVHVLWRTMQRQHAGGGGAAERRGDAKLLPRGIEQRIVQSGKARAHLAVSVGALLR